MTEGDVAVINARLDSVQRELMALSGVTKDVAASLHVLVRLEENYKNVSERLKNGSTTLTEHEKRLQVIETAMPGLAELRRWVIGGVLAGAGMMGLSLAKLTLVDIPVMHKAVLEGSRAAAPVSKP